MNRWDTSGMDLIELARTVHEDHRRQIEETTRRRRLLEPSMPSAAGNRDLPPARPAGTRSGQSAPSTSTAR
jgi:hypothetical protein